MMVLGIDPGVSEHGYAILSLDSSGRPKATSRAGVLRLKPIDLKRWVVQHTSSFLDLIAVETPEGFVFEHKRGAALVQTAAMAGQIAASLVGCADQVLTASAQAWRKAILSNASASDALIRLYIKNAVPGWPKRSSVHARDAAGVALYLGRQYAMAQR
jgi:crossover junction endodeoxyribonuclease RuvC